MAETERVQQQRAMTKFRDPFNRALAKRITAYWERQHYHNGMSFEPPFFYEEIDHLKTVPIYGLRSNMVNGCPPLTGPRWSAAIEYDKWSDKP